MVKVSLFIQLKIIKDMFTLVATLKTRDKDMVLKNIVLDKSILANSKMAKSMDLERKSGLMEPSIQVNLKMVILMEMVFTNLEMAPNFVESLNNPVLTGLGSRLRLMEISNTKDISKTNKFKRLI